MPKHLFFSNSRPEPTICGWWSFFNHIDSDRWIVLLHLRLITHGAGMLSLVNLMVGPASLYGVRLILARVRLVMAQEMEGLAEIIKVVQDHPQERAS